jgi:hypothetical protein
MLPHGKAERAIGRTSDCVQIFAAGRVVVESMNAVLFCGDQQKNAPR